MVSEFTLKGLNCANCAANIEESIRKLEGLLYASINLMTATLRIETAGGYGKNLFDEIKHIVHQHEPDIIVREKAKVTETENGTNIKAKIIWLLAGGLILATGILIENLLDFHRYLPFALFVFAYLLLGGKVLVRAAKNISQGKIFDENFLMAIATIGAFAIGEYAEAVAVMLFYQVGEFFQDMAVQNSRKTITGLMDIRPDYANVQKDGQIIKVAPETVNIGDFIIVKPGEKIPLDGLVIEGQSMLDTSALTGESVPRRVSPSDTVLSGCVNQNGVLTIQVTKVFGESTASKIIDLIENAAAKKAPTESFITKFASYYTPVVVTLAALIALIPPLLFSGLWSDWINRGLIFLVISCPCALVISIPLGFFGGIGGASKKGILVKGGNYLEALSNVDIAVFDKTGTLTKGVFKVTVVQAAAGFSEAELLETAAYAEAFSNHPIALSIRNEYTKIVDKSKLSDYNEIAGLGVSVNFNGRTLLAGNKNLMLKMGVAFDEVQTIGTKVYIALDNVYMGCIVISDEIKPDSYEAIASIKAAGVRKTVMLTGDNPQIAEAIGKELNIDEIYSGLLPHEKVEMVETLSSQKNGNGKLIFVGDGINDAPVLAMADIGVAMGGLGSDAAIEASDVVLMTDEPSKIAEAVRIARFTKRIVWQNIFFALGIKALFLLLGAMGMASMWEAVFADVGVAVLAILNAMRVMRA